MVFLDVQPLRIPLQPQPVGSTTSKVQVHGEASQTTTSLLQRKINIQNFAVSPNGYLELGYYYWSQKWWCLIPVSLCYYSKLQALGFAQRSLLITGLTGGDDGLTSAFRKLRSPSFLALSHVPIFTLSLFLTLKSNITRNIIKFQLRLRLFEFICL